MGLDDAQQRAIQRILEEPTKAALIASTTGSGKTRIALTAAKELNAQTVLVVAPGDTFQNPLDGWQSEVEDHLPYLKDKQYVIDSKNLHYLDRLREGEPGVYYITRTYFTLAGTDGVHPPETEKNPTKKPIVFRPKVIQWSTLNHSLDVVILDEVHQLSNRKGQGASALTGLQPRLLKLAMSATPGGDHFEGLWAPTRWLWPNTVRPNPADSTDTTDTTHKELYIDRSFWRWAAKWGTMEKANHPGATKYSMKVSGEKNPGAFTSSLPCYIRDQPPNIKVPIDPWYEVELDFTPEQKRQYSEMLTKSIAWLEDNPLVAELPVVQKVRLRQMCLGEVHFNEDGEVDFPLDTKSTKISAAVKIVKDRHPEDKVMMYVGDSQKFATVVAHRLREAGIPAEAWHGKVSKKRRREIKDRFVRGTTEDLQVIVASVTSISDGVDGLQKVCNTEIWFNKSLYGIKNEQAEGRLNRRGQAKPFITRYDLVIPNTADADTFAMDARKFVTRMKELG